MLGAGDLALQRALRNAHRLDDLAVRLAEHHAQQEFALPGGLGKLAFWHGERAAWVLDAWTGTWLDPAFADWSLDPVLPRVRCPVLALHGDRDEYGSEAFPRRIVAGVAGPARMVLLDDCGHMPHREHPGRVLAEIAAFVSQAAEEALRG